MLFKSEILKNHRSNPKYAMEPAFNLWCSVFCYSLCSKPVFEWNIVVTKTVFLLLSLCSLSSHSPDWKRPARQGRCLAFQGCRSRSRFFQCTLLLPSASTEKNASFMKDLRFLIRIYCNFSLLFSATKVVYHQLWDCMFSRRTHSTFRSLELKHENKLSLYSTWINVVKIKIFKNRL